MRRQARQVRGLRNIEQITVGGGHSCALTRNGRVSCWGFNIWGQLGLDDYEE
ncbi:MAG: hypothetical protein ACK4NW_07165 [Roseinatronobacter sp.]